ncbi:MAG: hypothetical protein J6R47_03880 [Acholeplasmatales bacterium]|nr:hypothetical protein [Acholeplasmatales bacterium]
MKNNYTADHIKVLSDLQHMRLRKSMYIGEGKDPRSLITEIIDNAIDEVQAGYSEWFEVHVNTKENWYIVRDYGRGIPHGKKKLESGEEKEIVEVLLSKANSGGKFDNSAYLYSSGLHGVGLTVTRALSQYMVVKSMRGTKMVMAECNDKDDLEVTYWEGDKQQGTEVSFIPNPKYFTSAKIPIEYIQDKCKVASALGYRGKLFVDGSEVKTDATIFDLIKEENSNISTYVNVQPIEVIAKSEEKMKVAIRYTSETNDRYFGFTNLLINYLGGTHVQELSKTIIAAWKEFIDKHKNIKPAVELHSNDYLVGLRAVCAVFISHTEFSSQTKEKLVVNRKYFEELMELFKNSFMRYLEDNILIAQQLIKRFEEYRTAQNALTARKEISSLIKVNEDNEDNVRRRSVVSKLVECTSRKRANTELFLVEGDSAKGPYLFTRNKELQAILPLRGKILNVTCKTIKEAVQNNEICDIANAIGCGIGPSCDAKKSRYDKIVISSDADVDGQHITSLICSLFINLFPDLVKAGRVWIAVPPLYCWGKDAKSYGWCNKVEDIPKNAPNLHRFKGLGEMNNDQLKYFCVDPDTRRQIQLEYPADPEEFNRILGSAAGKNDLLKELGIIEEGR